MPRFKHLLTNLNVDFVTKKFDSVKRHGDDHDKEYRNHR